ncbi:MAG: 16S rRNA (guanine(527)-N(7))-methyltransferase RsmG [Acidobacteriota bacterium]
MSDPVRPPRPWLDPEVLKALDPMLEMLADDPASLSSVTAPARAREVHLIDSLSGLVVEEVNRAGRIIDIGSGAGFPGVPLALARPSATVDLLDSVGRKVEFINDVIARLGIGNARAIKARSEEWAAGAGSEAYDLATARAVAPLAILAEFASPLLDEGGSLVAWKGEREPESESTVTALGPELALEIDRVIPVRPFEGSRVRHLYVLRKTGPTPARLPRRPGMARKRPLAL